MRDITLFQTPESSMKTQGQTLCTRPTSSLADSPEDCQGSPKSAFFVAFLLTLFYFKKDQTHCSVREILISSVSSRKAGLLSHRGEQNSSCSALHEALVQLFLFWPAPQTARKIKFKPCCILLHCHAAGTISLPCFQDCNLTLSKPDGSDWQELLQVDKSQHTKKKNPLGPWQKGQSHASSLIKITASQVADTFPLSW